MRCLESLSRDSFSGRRTVFLIDNALSLERSIAGRFPSLRIELVRPPQNLGFAEGCARGIARAMACGADFVLLLNNDAVVEALCLDLLVKAAADSPEAGLLSPHIVTMSSPPRPWYVGGSFSLWSGVPVQARRRSGIEGIGAPREVDYATGCAMLIRPAVIESVGSLDSRFFAYCEDLDFSLRARDAGFKVLVVPRARVYHEAADGDLTRAEHLLQHPKSARRHPATRVLVPLDGDHAELPRALARLLHRTGVPARPARPPPCPRGRRRRLRAGTGRGAEGRARAGGGASGVGRMNARGFARLRWLFDYRTLLKYLVLREIKVKSRGTYLGIGWTLMNPLFTIIVYFVALQSHLQGGGYPTSSTFFLLGFLMWVFFARSASMAATRDPRQREHREAGPPFHWRYCRSRIRVLWAPCSTT